MRHSLAAHLVDFSAPIRRVGVAAPAPLRDFDSEIEAVRVNAFDEGYAAGIAAAKEEAATRLQESEQRAQQELLTAREEWAQSVATLLSERVDAALCEAEEEIAAAIARILADIATIARKPVIAEDAVARLRPLLRDNTMTRIEMSGPPDLLQAIAARFENHTFERIEAEGRADLRVRVDRTVLDTRLDAWRETLLEALAVRR